MPKHCCYGKQTLQWKCGEFRWAEKLYLSLKVWKVRVRFKWPYWFSVVNYLMQEAPYTCALWFSAPRCPDRWGYQRQSVLPPTLTQRSVNHCLLTLLRLRAATTWMSQLGPAALSRHSRTINTSDSSKSLPTRPEALGWVNTNQSYFKLSV